MNTKDIKTVRAWIAEFNCDLYAEYVSPFNFETSKTFQECIWIDEINGVKFDEHNTVQLT